MVPTSIVTTAVTSHDMVHGVSFPSVPAAT